MWKGLLKLPVNQSRCHSSGIWFLAENPYFARRCEEENIIFIGPSASAIYKMGNKTIAKQIAQKYKVPLLQGSQGNVKESKGSSGYCLENRLSGDIESCSRRRRTWHAYCGKGLPYWRRCLKWPPMKLKKLLMILRYLLKSMLKIQGTLNSRSLGDRHGNYIHLGERECSIQRKHQKLIEESPSVALDENLRQEMGQAAISIAKAVNYYSAGTVEFLLDADQNFFFMEMNTRIQVEHPVTEMVSGVDLIELQIKIAEGHKLPSSRKILSLPDGPLNAGSMLKMFRLAFLRTWESLRKCPSPREKTSGWIAGLPIILLSRLISIR